MAGDVEPAGTAETDTDAEAPSSDVGVGGLVPPAPEQIGEYAAEQFASADDFDGHFAKIAPLFERLDALADPHVPLRYPNRDPGSVPDEAEDPYNAIIRFCDVSGAETGPLAGMRIGVKDVIPVAGVPMTGGRRDRPASVPSEDAVVVERLLDAGAHIVAKTNVYASFGAEFGDTRNPLDPRFSPGYSSSGSGAAVAAGMVDASLGTDIAGSVRIPAAWCGLVGMKASRGLVPLHGCRDKTANCIGPLTTTVADNAAILEVMAGPDWRDPEAVRVDPGAGAYTSAAGLGVAGLRIGVVAESLEPSGCTPGTLRPFERAQKILADLGADVSSVSVQLWTETEGIFVATALPGQVAADNAFGDGYANAGRADPALVAASVAQCRGEDHRKGQLLVEYLRHAYQARHVVKAQNLRLELRRQVERQLADVDVLITPTTATGPFELSQGPRGDTEMVNARALNLTGHPALTVPAGLGDDDLPTGLQIVGRMFDERTVYRVGFAFEAAAS